MGTTSSSVRPVVSNRVPAAQATRRRAILLSAVGAALAASGVQAAPYIGVDFVGNQGRGAVPMDPASTAGVFPQANWNNVFGRSVNNQVLNNASGAPTGVTLSMNATEEWTTGSGNSTPNHQLYHGYVSAQNGGTNTVSLNGIGAGFYDLVLYTMRDGSDPSTYFNSASGLVYNIRHQRGSDYVNNPQFIRATSTNPATPQTGNYVQWDGLVVTEGQLSFSMRGGFRAPVSGFQLLTSSQPVRYWSGQVNGLFDTSTPNFSGQTFSNGNNLIFRDTDANGAPVVNRTVSAQLGTAAPGGVIVSNSAGAYTFNGSSVRNAAFVKSGTDSLTFGGPADNAGLAINVSAGTLALNKASSRSVHAVGAIGSVKPGATVRLDGIGNDQIVDSGDISQMDGTFDMNGRNERFGTLSGNGNVVNAPSVLTFGSGASGTFSGTIENSANTTLVKEGFGKQGLGRGYDGPIIVNDGSIELAGNAKATHSVTLYASGTRSDYVYTGGQSQTRNGGLGLTNLSGDPLGDTPVVMHGGEVFHNTNGSVKDYTLRNVTTASALNTFSNQPSGGARPLTLLNLTRAKGATIEFKANWGTIGAAGDNGQVKITNITEPGQAARPMANTNGIMGGWATAYKGDGDPWNSTWATYDPNTGAKAYAGPYKSQWASSGELLPTDNLFVDSNTGASNAQNTFSAQTITSDATVNSVIARNDNALTINAGATLKVNSGGVLITYGNGNQITGGGKLTSGLASGELFVHSYDSAFGENDRFEINVDVVNNGSTPTTLIKSGYGTFTIYADNSTYTGGTIINAGQLTVANNNAVGQGPITVAPGGRLALGRGPGNATISVANDLYLNGTSPGGTLRSRAPDAGAQSYYNGTIHLNRTSSVGSTSGNDNLFLNGKITGPGGLIFTSGGRIIIGSAENDYLGDTEIEYDAEVFTTYPDSPIGSLPLPRARAT